MALTSEDIGRIARLARLELQPSESGRLLHELNDFFGIVEKMRAVDTMGIDPLAHPVAAFQEVALRLRDDLVGAFPSREDSQKSAPSVEDGLYLVPRVIE